MARPQPTLRELLRLLPDLDELEEVRASLASASAPDPAQRWAGSSLYATVDQRVLAGAELEVAVAEAERAAREQVEGLFGAVREALRSYTAGDDVGAARALIALGEQRESAGRFADARRCFRSALEVTLPQGEKEAQILALRRIARASRALGELDEALACYRRSLELATDSGDLAGAIIAETGLGNVLATQGRFAEAEGCYRQALARTEEAGDAGAFDLQRAQLFNNLGMVLTRRGRLDEAERWFDRARGAWERIESPADLAVCGHNHGLLRLRQGRPEEARAELEAALSLADDASVRAAIAVDLAECCVQSGLLTEAERWSREAEEHAISSRSTYALGHLYLGLGKLARARGDTNGFVFYEKALEIARQCAYHLLEAETLLDYAPVREELGGADEARAYVERAREIFQSLGITSLQHPPAPSV